MGKRKWEKKRNVDAYVVPVLPGAGPDLNERFFCWSLLISVRPISSDDQISPSQRWRTEEASAEEDAEQRDTLFLLA